MQPLLGYRMEGIQVPFFLQPGKMAFDSVHVSFGLPSRHGSCRRSRLRLAFELERPVAPNLDLLVGEYPIHAPAFELQKPEEWASVGIAWFDVFVFLKRAQKPLRIRKPGIDEPLPELLVPMIVLPEFRFALDHSDEFVFSRGRECRTIFDLIDQRAESVAERDVAVPDAIPFLLNVAPRGANLLQIDLDRSQHLRTVPVGGVVDADVHPIETSVDVMGF